MDSVQQWLAVFRAMPWSDVKAAAELLLYYLTVIAVLGCLMRLRTIAQILRDFREARGPLWELQKTVSDLKTLEPALKALGGHVAQVEQKVDAARKQVAELQVETTSTRTEAVDGDEPPPPTPAGGISANQSIEDNEEKNWESLRDQWRKNTERIEYVIDNKVLDGRSRGAYDRLPRTNYTRIVNKLQGQGVITAAAANASRDLIDLFNSYRPRNRTVPDEVVASLAILSKQLDQELVPYESVVAASSEEEPTPPEPPRTPPTDAPRSRRNVSRSEQNLPGSTGP